MTAATADLHCSRSDDRYQLEVASETVGLARSVWKFDVRHTSVSDARTLRPVRVREVETQGSKHLETEVNFTPEAVAGRRVEQGKNGTKTTNRSFEFPNVLSVSSALLYLRSKSLTDGTVERLVVYPSTNAYVCTVAVLGREQLSVPTGSYGAIKLDMKLNKVGKNHELVPYKKFKRATVWLSNDADRLILRIEAQISFGTVFGELQSVQFENGK